MDEQTHDEQGVQQSEGSAGGAHETVGAPVTAPGSAHGRGLRRRLAAATGTAIVLGAGSVVLVAAHGGGGHHKGHHKGAHGATAVTLAAASVGTASSAITVSGVIAPQSTVTVSPPSAGTVTAVDVAPGQQVHAGQVLAQMNTSVAQANLTQAQAAVATAQAKLAAAAAPSTAASIALAQANVQKAQADLAAAELTLQQVSAPLPAVSTPSSSSAGSSSSTATSTSGSGGNSSSAAGGSGSGGGSGGSGSGGSGSGGSGLGSAGSGSSGSSSSSVKGAALTPAQQAAQQAAQIAQAQAGVTQAQANVAVAQAQLAQAQSGPSSVSLQPLQAAVTQAQDQVKLAQLQLNDETLTAPVSGTVSAVPVSAGDSVGGGGAVVELQSSQLQVQATVDQQDYGLMHPGEQVTITDAAGSQTIPGVVASVSPTGNAQSLSFTVLITPTSQPSWLATGESASVSIVTSSQSGAVIVPTAAIVNINGSSQVFTAARTGKKPQKVALVNVTTSLSNGQDTVVTGIPGGTEVVVAGQSYLAAGDLIRAVTQQTVPTSVQGQAVGGLQSNTATASAGAAAGGGASSGGAAGGGGGRGGGGGAAGGGASAGTAG